MLTHLPITVPYDVPLWWLQIEEWKERAGEFDKFVADFKKICQKFQMIPNRCLMYDMNDYLWDLRGTIAVLNSYIKWLGNLKSGKPLEFNMLLSFLLPDCIFSCYWAYSQMRFYFWEIENDNTGMQIFSFTDYHSFSVRAWSQNSADFFNAAHKVVNTKFCFYCLIHHLRNAWHSVFTHL